jgi:DNA polymerase-3 subunit delta
MIIKSFEVDKIKSKNYKSILLYGVNQGLKEELIKTSILKDFSGEILKYDEAEVLEKSEIILESLLNGSLFDEKKLILISRCSNKIYSFIEKFLEKDISQVLVVLNSENLDKKSKLRTLYEKSKDLICVPFYEDNQQSLSIFANKYLQNRNIKLSREILNLIIERSQGDRGNLQNELQKIENLSLSKKNISNEDIINITNLAENYTVFALVDNYLAKNQKKVSKIINENNFVNDDSIIILRTLLSRSKRLLKLKNMQNVNKSIDDTIAVFRPPIFWKEKDVVKQQMRNWSEDEVKGKIFEISNLEIIIKRSTSSINLVSDLISNY